MSNGAFKEVDQQGGKPHWSSTKIAETITVVLVTSILSTILNSGVTRLQIEQAQKKNEQQDAEFVRLTREVVELQKQTVALTTQLAASQKQQDEHQNLLLDIIQRKSR